MRPAPPASRAGPAACPGDGATRAPAGAAGAARGNPAGRPVPARGTRQPLAPGRECLVQSPPPPLRRPQPGHYPLPHRQHPPGRGRWHITPSG